ncbi:hypothetical protein MC885_010008 [Smutsia gigantea]|nr:hypothetical protein MC885_010008 [Smutsia gigantea]
MGWPPKASRNQGLTSPVPVSTFTFCVLPSFTATRFSTLAMSSQASPRPYCCVYLHIGHCLQTSTDQDC